MPDAFYRKPILKRLKINCLKGVIFFKHFGTAPRANY